jgi:hypothetical protein
MDIASYMTKQKPESKSKIIRKVIKKKKKASVTSAADSNKLLKQLMISSSLSNADCMTNLASFSG